MAAHEFIQFKWELACHDADGLQQVFYAVTHKQVMFLARRWKRAGRWRVARITESSYRQRKDWLVLVKCYRVYWKKGQKRIRKLVRRVWMDHYQNAGWISSQWERETGSTDLMARAKLKFYNEAVMLPSPAEAFLPF